MDGGVTRRPRASPLPAPIPVTETKKGRVQRGKARPIRLHRPGTGSGRGGQGREDARIYLEESTCYLDNQDSELDADSVLRVCYSNRTEELLEALIEAITTGERSIFDPVHIAVPNQNLETYLELALARETGICSNVSFHRANEILRRRSSFVNPVLTALFDDELLAEPELEPVRTYLAAGGDEPRDVDHRRVQLGRELARLFALYEDYRPELFEGWRTGLFVRDDASREVETWQRRLWLELTRDAVAEMRDVPSPLHIFGVSYLPRAHIQLLERVVGDIHLYVLNPCREGWEPSSVIAPSSSPAFQFERRGRSSDTRTLDPFELSRPTEIPPLRLWGRAGRESLRLTNAITGCEVVARMVETEPGSLLEQLQHRHRGTGEPERTSIPEDFDYSGDESIVVLESANVRRELEAIGAEIWRLMGDDDSDEPLRFNDVAVILTPSVAERYHALVGSVFDEMHELPHNIVDLPVRSESRLSEAVALLLDIPSSELGRGDIMRFATHPTTMASFPEASRDDWLSWCDALGIVRGVDRRDQDDTYVEKDVFNWDQGLKRLALGTFMSGEPSGDDRLFRQGDETYLPEEITSEDVPSAGRMGLFVRSLLSDARDASRVHMTVPAWMGLHERLHHDLRWRPLARGRAGAGESVSPG